jgi:hypothetical protein
MTKILNNLKKIENIFQKIVRFDSEAGGCDQRPRESACDLKQRRR